MTWGDLQEGDILFFQEVIEPDPIWVVVRKGESTLTLLSLVHDGHLSMTHLDEPRTIQQETYAPLRHMELASGWGWAVLRANERIR